MLSKLSWSVPPSEPGDDLDAIAGEDVQGPNAGDPAHDLPREPLPDGADEAGWDSKVPRASIQYQTVLSGLSETRVRGSNLPGTTCAGPWAWLSSTARMGCGCSYGETPSARLVQRYYSNLAGRFYSPDPIGVRAANPLNPVSWNRYAYTGGDPVNRVDRSGTVWACVSAGGPASCEYFPDTEVPGVTGTRGAGMSRDAMGFEWGMQAEMVGDGERGGGGGGGGGGGAGGPLDVTFGNETFHNVVNVGAQYDVVKNRLGTIRERLENDPGCMSWLTLGSHGGIVADKALFSDMVNNHTGVTSWIEVDGNKVDSIAAQANVSSTWSILVNAAGAFFWGGSIPGTQLTANTPSGQILVLLHELAHVTGTLAAGDQDPGRNSQNNTAALSQCQKTILGN
jgi:RHS repeat-associated protein